MPIAIEFRKKVREAVLSSRQKYSGSDAHFAKSIGINNAVFSRLKKGEIDGIIAENVWLTLGRIHNVSHRSRDWKLAKTQVYRFLEENLTFCKAHSKAMVLIDECGIGKTACSKHIVSTMRDAFYVDCSQGKTKQQFVRLLAKSVGLESKGRYIDVKNNLKYYLNSYLDAPLIVLDDAGYLDYPAFLEIQELWNATENACGWYMIGDDSLQYKIQKGINSKRIGYKAIFDRFSKEFLHVLPTGVSDKQGFLSVLLTDVAYANVTNKDKIPEIVKKCLTKQATLRYLETLIQTNV